MRKLIFLALSCTLLVGCSFNKIFEGKYQLVDDYIEIIDSNIKDLPQLSNVIAIDHSRLANQAEEPLLPSKVIMFHDPVLESSLIEKERLIALDMPLKILVYMDENGDSNVIWNQTRYFEERYNVSFTVEEKQQYDEAMSDVLNGVPESALNSFTSDKMAQNDVITIESELSLEETISKALEVISRNDDVTIFKEIDYQKLAAQNDIKLPPTYLIMYGAPSPGGKAMKQAQTLGLDAFPQKLLVWQNEMG
jgi:uncharacterized protein (DUF302 family)